MDHDSSRTDDHAAHRLHLRRLQHQPPLPLARALPGPVGLRAERGLCRHHPHLHRAGHWRRRRRRATIQAGSGSRKPPDCARVPRRGHGGGDQGHALLQPAICHDRVPPAHLPRLRPHHDPAAGPGARPSSTRLPASPPPPLLPRSHRVLITLSSRSHHALITLSSRSHRALTTRSPRSCRPRLRSPS